MAVKRITPRGAAQHRGMSLIEILVGVAIGLIGVVAIFQAVAVSTRQTQTTSSGGDSQVAGTLALFNLERDLKQAGQGVGKAVTPVLGCDVIGTDTAPPRPINFKMQPVEIVPGGGGAPDRINVLYGNSSFYVSEQSFSNADATSNKLARRDGFKRGDLAVAAFNPGALPGSAACQLIEITDNTNLDGFTVAHTTGTYTSDYGTIPVVARFNSATPPVSTGGTLYSLGPQPQRNTWFIANRSLVRQDLIRNPIPLPVAEGVINLKAAYGYDVDGNGQIADAEWMAALPANADLKKVLAIRVSVLVRGKQFERSRDPGASAVSAVTVTNPAYFVDIPQVAGTFEMTNIDGTPDTYSNSDAVPNNWRYYRYRVYERVIPLRNMLWGIYG